jgi:Asp-tRNA(Asn)/Glu-tRNA(Gln) amidotransferase A subunit family amidase
LVAEGFGRPESDPDTDAAVREALARMQAAGAELEDVLVPAHDEMFDIWNAICTEGTAALMFGASTGSYGEGSVSMSLLDAFAQGWRDRPDALSPTAILAAARPMIGNTAPLNGSGHPAISIPCAMRNGLPIGLMLIGRHFDDGLTLRGAAGLEALGNWQEQ